MKKDMPGQKKMKPEIRTFVVIWRQLKFYQTFKRGNKHGQIQFSEDMLFLMWDRTGKRVYYQIDLEANCKAIG